MKNNSCQRTDTISIQRASIVRDGDLNCFLRTHPTTTVFHSEAWHHVIRTTYGHECDYWVARCKGTIVGVFPVVRVAFPFLGTKHIAMPYQYHSGIPRAENADIQRELVQRAIQTAIEAKARYFEVRHNAPCSLLTELGLRAVDSGLVSTITSLENLELRHIRRNMRRNIVAAEKQGVTISEGNSMADLRSFWSMYSAEGRTLGAPLAGWRFFENAAEALGRACRLLMAWSSGKLLGCFWTVDDGRTCFARCGVYSSKEATRLHVGQALRWEAIQRASRRGCLEFDHGISWSGDRGLIHHKEGWRGSTSPIYVYVYPIRSTPPEPGRYFEGYKLAKAVWRTLPLPLVNAFGSVVTRWVC